MLHIDKPEMFKEALSKGINIFAGAGFSKLPDSNGKYLPTANELCDDICSAFSISTSLNLDLEQISSLVNLKAKDRFQSYLREKYTVTEYNPLYDTLNEIALNSFITTNIDNIVQCVMDHSKRYSLHDIAVYGAHKRGSDFSLRDNNYILWSVASMQLYIVFLPFSQNEMFILEDRDNVHFE